MKNQDFRIIVTGQLTPIEYQAFQEYVKKHDTNVSSAIRFAILSLLEKAGLGLESNIQHEVLPAVPAITLSEKLKLEIELLKTFLQAREVALPNETELQRIYTKGAKKPFPFFKWKVLVIPKKLPNWLSLNDNVNKVSSEIEKLKFDIELLLTFFQSCEIVVPDWKELKQLYIKGYRKPMPFGQWRTLVESHELPDWAND